MPPKTQAPRSQNLNDKPKMKAWLSRDTPATRTFKKVVEYLRSHYIGTNQGYTDNIKYRFNSKREGGHIVVTGQEANTKIKIVRSVDTETSTDISIVNNPEASNETLEKTLSEFLIKNKVRDFDFLENEVEASLELSEAERLKRIKNYPATPEKISITTVGFKRNQHIIAQRLFLAKGICEGCKNPAPFQKKNNGEPYLEVHHIILLSENGEDTVKNTIALCPNCHREKHFG